MEDGTSFALQVVLTWNIAWCGILEYLTMFAIFCHLVEGQLKLLNWFESVYSHCKWITWYTHLEV